MIAKRRTNLLYLMILWLSISALVWPAFVLASTLLSWFAGQSWQLDAWTQIPKREILKQFIQGYISSAVFAAAIGLVAVIDHALLSRYRLTWVLGGILLPVAGIVIAYVGYQNPEIALPSLVLTGLILAVVHRLADIIAGNSRRGRLR